MLIMIFKWWYGAGWAKAFRNIQSHTLGVGQSFSIPILIKTLFEPWKRIITYPGKSLDDHIKAAIDNLVSRFVGLSVRLIVLLTAGLLTALTAIGYSLLAIIWPLIPVAIVYCIFRGILG